MNRGIVRIGVAALVLFATAPSFAENGEESVRMSDGSRLTLDAVLRVPKRDPARHPLPPWSEAKESHVVWTHRAGIPPGGSTNTRATVIDHLGMKYRLRYTGGLFQGPQPAEWSNSWLLTPAPPLGEPLRLRFELESPSPRDLPVELRVPNSPESASHQLDARNLDAWLAFAVSRDDPDLVRAFLERGAQPNVRGDYGFTPLMVAAFHRDLPLVQSLLDRGSGLDVKNNAGATALFYAIFGAGRVGTEIAEFLLSHGADPNLGGAAIATPIDWAAQYGEADVVRALLARGARPRASALHSAIDHEHPEVAMLLQKAMRR